ncbi:MAG: tetratricopeptide repeat protein, partial [Thiotrichaceae bacterium]|nr:tetratricopeptide repeat protein [Thiotrichaceae bacterium]
MSNKLIAIIILIGILSGCQDSRQRAEEREKFGIELFEKGDYSKAQLEFKSALKEDGTLATTYYYLALLNEKNRSYKAMRGNLIQVVKLTPDNIDARLKLGQIHLLFDDLDAALIEADEVLRYSKDNADALLLKSAVFIKQDKQGDALVLIEEILQKDPEHIEAISLKALVLMLNEQFESALMLVNPVIDSGVDDVALHMLKIQLDAKQKNIDAVVADYERLVKLYPDKKEFKFALAKMYAQANRKRDAENLLREVVNSEPLEIQPKLILLDFLNSLG